MKSLKFALFLILILFALPSFAGKVVCAGGYFINEQDAAYAAENLAAALNRRLEALYPKAQLSAPTISLNRGMCMICVSVNTN